MVKIRNEMTSTALNLPLQGRALKKSKLHCVCLQIKFFNLHYVVELENVRHYNANNILVAFTPTLFLPMGLLLLLKPGCILVNIV